MDFLLRRAPTSPLEARTFHCPATAINLDTEIAGVFWFYFCWRTMAQLFPEGLRFSVHVHFETEDQLLHEDEEPEDEGGFRDDDAMWDDEGDGEEAEPT